jgi:hypothetical protein
MSPRWAAATTSLSVLLHRHPVNDQHTPPLPSNVAKLISQTYTTSQHHSINIHLYARNTSLPTAETN